MLPHLARPSGDDGALPPRHRREGLLPEGRVEGRSPSGSSASRCRRRTASSNYPLVTDARGAAVAGEPELHHAARVDVARAGAVPSGPLRLRSRSRSRTSPRCCAHAALRCAICSRSSACTSWVKTSGSKGFHIVVPLDGRPTSSEVARFAHAVGARSSSAIRSTSRRSSTRPIAAGASSSTPDATSYGATFAATYAVRPKPGAPVSAPCTWEEVESGGDARAADVHPAEHGATASPQVGDLWAEMPGESLDGAIDLLRRT